MNTQQNVFAVINVWTSEVLAEATHFQAAAKVEDEFVAEWNAAFVGPLWHVVHLPFSICRIDALGRYYPGIKGLVA
ncbi:MULTISPECIES: hypothetical protein [Pseudomonas]|uniref:hypothetical protein n=1 Tax=Pseudomonas TaxID=286 RepID=UPI0010C0275F|nr:hypothetical protein [Pseudomonas asiatica]